MLTATQGSGEKASTSSYTYDSVGNVTSVTNGNGKVTSYSYDQLSNLVERMTSLGDKETYTYNVNNQLEKVTKSDGKTISYDYNKLDQLLKVEYSEKQDGQVLYTYDADGRRVSMSDLTGTSQYATNEEGEITGVRQGDGSLIQYEYDAYGNISKMIYPDGSTVSYTYDELDRLTSVTDVKGQKTSYSYNPAGDLTEVDRGDGTKSFLTYDKAHRLTELRHMDKQDKLISSYGYEYDDGGYIAKETIKQDGETLVHTYTYDTLGQVENMTVSDASGKELSKLSYTYDLAGNKLTSNETVDGKESQTRFTYDDHNRLTKLEGPDGTITYTYDKNGNRIASEKNSEKLDYIYDIENRLLAIKDKKGLLMAALYDGDDNRVFTASRKEGKNTYQLFQRKPKESKSGRKSPYTAPSGEENSLFWYGFSQNVLQALSTLPQTVGSIWHSIFDDVSRAYHQKVAKDRASKEGIVVNPPELGNLPGQGEVTYASQVQDVLIPYTTREDTYNYYEERNYVNDVNREHTEVLETYDHDGKARVTYSYGQGRASYLNNQTGDSYNYLTNQSGSVTGLTKDGQAVASSRYNLYGARKTSTDTTGNPFAYNGEARDDTGLDYLRARYYDSQGGTFLTEDSYPGEETDPLSQNRYSYVQNNPVNYTDPSGHFWNSIKKGWNYVKSGLNWAGRQISRGVNWVGRQISRGVNWVGRQIDRGVNWVGRQIDRGINWVGRQIDRGVNWVGRQWNKVQTTYNSTVDYVQTKYQQAQARIQELHYQAIRTAYAVAIGFKASPTIREGMNLLRNWGTALQNTLKHVCDPKTTGASDKGENKVPSVADFRKYEDAARHGLRPDQKERIDRMTLEEYLKAPPMTPEENAYASNVKFAKFNQENKAKLPTLAAEFIGWNNGERLVTGKDPLTGEDANRWAAGAELAVDIASNFFPIAKAGKLRKLEKALDAVDAVNDASKATKAADKAKDASKAAKAADKASDAARVADKVDDVKDVNKIPQYVEDTISQIKNNKGNPPDGFKGGKVYKNEPLDGEELLPDGITYKEYDVHPYQKGVRRGMERIVIGEDGSIWYTQDHYQTFIRIK